MVDVLAEGVEGEGAEAAVDGGGGGAQIPRTATIPFQESQEGSAQTQSPSQS